MNYLPIIIAACLLVIPAMVHAQDAPENANPVVIMKTNKGTIEIELFSDKAPETVRNFLSYVFSGFYTGTVFHRVIENFMIQGGGFTEDMTKKETLPPIKNEATNGLSNKRGTIAMARTMVVDSASSQFFINVVDNGKNLDHKNTSQRGYGYCVFGQVIKGMDVVDKIRRVATTSVHAPDGTPYRDVPVKAVIIESVTLKE